MRFPTFESTTDRRTQWFERPEVQSMLRAEQGALIPWLAPQIGVRGLYLRAASALPATLAGNMLQHVSHLYRRGAGFAGDFDSRDECLPLLSDSLQLAYAQHVLETSPSPQALLGELARCLQPEGVLVVVSLARYAPWRWQWRGRGLQPMRRDDLLRECEQLGLAIEREVALGPRWLRWSSATGSIVGSAGGFPPLRPSWAVLARKRRVGMTAVGRVGQLRMQPRAWPT